MRQFLILGLACLAAWADVSAARASQATADAAAPSATTATAPQAATSSDTSEPLDATSPEPEGALDLATALALALERSPELAAYSLSIRVAEARLLQAGLRPNPELRLEAEDFAGTGAFSGFDEAQGTVVLSQLVELGGKRAARRREAALEQDLAGWDYETKRVDVLTATSQAFVEVLAQQQGLGIADEAVGLAEQVAASASRRVVAGSSSRAEQTKAEVALAAARIEREQTTRMLAAARLRLAASWGATIASFDRVVGDFSSTAPVPELGSLRNRLANNPDLARWSSEIERREAEVTLRRSGAFPDVVVGAGYRRLAGPDENAVVAEITIPLPIFDRKQGAIAEAEHRLGQARVQRRAVEVGANAALAAAYESLASAHARVTALEASVLPGASEVFDTLRDGYREGRFSYLDVLDAQRTLVTARAQRIRALADYHQSLASMERLIGESAARGQGR